MLVPRERCSTRAENPNPTHPPDRRHDPSTLGDKSRHGRAPDEAGAAGHEDGGTVERRERPGRARHERTAEVDAVGGAAVRSFLLLRFSMGQPLLP